MIGHPRLAHQERNILYGSLQDITERKHHEAALEKHRLQLVNSSKLSALGEMASGIAHEINNPLTVIEGNLFQLRALLTSPKEKFPEEQVEKILDKFSRNTERISRIVRSMSTISYQGNYNEAKWLNFSKLVEDILELSFFKFNQAKIEVNVKDISPHLEIYTDENILSQVLINLINNSYDELVTLGESKEKEITVSCVEDNKSWVIRFSDSGKGIPLDIENKILNPFFTTKEQGKGTGLGLSISKSLLEGVGQSMEIESFRDPLCFKICLVRPEESKAAG